MADGLITSWEHLTAILAHCYICCAFQWLKKIVNIGNQLPVFSASSFVMSPPRPNIAAASRAILGFLLAFAILFSAIDAHSIQFSMSYKLKKSTSYYRSTLLVAYTKASEYMKSENKRVLLQLIVNNLPALYSDSSFYCLLLQP